MALICDRCGEEILGGPQMVYYIADHGPVVIHKFPSYCNPAGVKMAQDLDQRFGEWKRSQEKPKK